MFDKFSISARRVVFWARYEAGRLGFEAIKSEHLLLGFIQEDQGDVPTILRDRGIDRVISPIAAAMPSEKQFLDSETAIKFRVEFSAPGPLNDPLASSVDMPLSEDAASALMAGQGHAHGATVGRLHLLWGLLENGESRLARFAVECGVTKELVENAIRGEDVL